MDVRIWFSGIWASRAHVIRMLRENPDGDRVHVFGTHTDPSAVALTACDEAGSEPEGDDDAYLAFALDFCRDRSVDVVVPSERLAAFASRADAFARVGTRVMCSPPAVVRTLTTKTLTYAAAAAAGVPVAPWWPVRDAEALRRAVGEIRADGAVACVKPAGERSFAGFRIVDDSRPGLAELLAPPRPRVTLTEMADALRRAADEGRDVPELVVMPYLEPPEISVDCLSDPSGRLLAGIPRVKEARLRVLADAPEAVDAARLLTGRLGVAYLSNVQLRHWRGRPVLLEVNPRPSAGVYQTAHAGVNLPWAAVRLMMRGDPGPLPEPRTGHALAIVNQAVPVR